jgi:hypothetical protein
VARWSDLCAEPGVLLPDRIHPDIDGQAAFAGVIGDGVSQSG